MSSNKTADVQSMKLPPVVDRIARHKDDSTDYKVPVCVLVVGMAGSGKTTLMARLQQATMMLEGEEGHDDSAKEQEESTAENQAQATVDNQEEEETIPTETSGVQLPAYCINLDPATLHLPYNVSIDIRDTVDYKVR